MAICLEGFNLVANPTLLWLVGVVIFAFYCSIPYWLSGMVGGVIQQMLLLNEQSVQDHRFTEESEALAKLTSLIFSFYALESGLIFSLSSRLSRTRLRSLMNLVLMVFLRC